MNTDIFSNQVGVNRLFVLVYSNQGNVKGLYFRMSVGLWLYQIITCSQCGMVGGLPQRS